MSNTHSDVKGNGASNQPKNKSKVAGKQEEKEFKLTPLSCLGVLLFTPLMTIVIKLVGSSFFQYLHHRWYAIIGILILHLIALIIGLLIVMLIINGLFYLSDKLFVKRFRY